MQRIEKLKIFMQKNFTDTRGSHDWEHTLRVYQMCKHIGKIENADIEILKYASLLHDIARHEQDVNNGTICHAERGAEIAQDLLKELGVEEEKIERICECIRTHRYRSNNPPKSKEAKILFDADKLDSIGAVGVGRAFLFSGEIGARFHDKHIDLKKAKGYSRDDTAYREYLIKLRYIKSRMLTKEGQKLAKERHDFMKEFFDRLNKEVDGVI